MIIVHILTRLLKAGSEENTIATCDAQRRAGHDVYLVHGHDFDPAVAKRASAVAELIKVDSIVHPISPINDVKASLEISRILKDLRADVVHTHQSKAGIVGRVGAALAGVPLIVHGVHILPFENVGKATELIYVTVERICARFTHVFISVSPSVRDSCLARAIGSPDQHFVAYSGMDVDRFVKAELPDDWRDVINVGPAAPRLPTALMLAAFEPRKRHLDFVKALPEAFGDDKNWRVVFAGQGETLSEVKQEVERLGLTEQVRFAGFRSDPEKLLALSDVGVLTSSREGLPRVLVQYAAAGLPAVATHIAGIEDILVDGVNGVVVPVDEVPKAAKAVAALLKDEAMRGKLAAGAQAVDVSSWRFDSMAQSIAQAYDAGFARIGSALRA